MNRILYDFKILPPTLILAPLSCYSKKRLFEELGECAGSVLEIPSLTIINALNERESLGSTYAGRRTALPQANLNCDRECAIFALLNKPVLFNNIDSQEVIVDIAYSFYFGRDCDYDKSLMMRGRLSAVLQDQMIINSLRLSRHSRPKIARILSKIDLILQNQFTEGAKTS